MKLWKVQKFFEDVVYDLRNRGLLPVVILLVVALAAVPILISRGGGSKSSSSPSSAQATAAGSSGNPQTEAAVVAYTPSGLRKYSDRLQGRNAKDPFVQPVDKGAAAASAQASALQSTVTIPSSSGSSSTSLSPSTGGSGSGGSSGGTTHTLYLYRSVADLSVGDVSQPLQRHKHIEAFTPLPSQVASVMIYLGSSLSGKHAYFSVSKSVDPITGDGTCAPSPTDCTLLVLGVGQTEDFTYTPDGHTYRVKINKINLVRKRVPTG